MGRARVVAVHIDAYQGNKVEYIIHWHKTTSTLYTTKKKDKTVGAR